MSNKLVYAQEAENDLNALLEFIMLDSKQRAINFIEEIENAILNLKEFPNMGIRAKYPELYNQDILVLTHKKYLIFYLYNEKHKEIRILRILNGSLNYKNQF